MGGGPLTSPAGRGICARMVFVLCLLYDTVSLTLLMLYREILWLFVRVPERQSSRFYSTGGLPRTGWGEGNRIHIHNQLGARARIKFLRGAKCGQGQWRNGADFSRVRLALGSSAGRPTHGSRKAFRWGVWWCACGWRARGSAGAMVCQVLRWPCWAICASCTQPGRVRWARPAQDRPGGSRPGYSCGREGDPGRGRLHR